ncbi:bifunctional adenosylcobinamide kinase/adenosylcobinamide-phosphate guanylyltransferase [Rosistilla oblonga]|uniref:bifunctional adenosylcobinamide kinase/adenosylcobinamide-phosphate guanylyltransferase n=1 Tax=Rosistilla oblonga TaxID=2527990 RepID=UPI003A97D880
MSQAVEQDQSSGPAGSVTLVLGGVRSGKSRFAQDLAAQIGGDDVLFVATAQASFQDQPADEEMTRRIDHHRRSRPSAWSTLEQPRDVGQAILQTSHLAIVVLVDCLTLLVSNVICDGDHSKSGLHDLEARVIAEVDALIQVAAKRPTHLIIVSGEVGCGIVPEHPLGRTFRDLLGLANQRLAASDATTYWMVAGLAINATAIASSTEQAAQQIKHLANGAAQ